MADTDWRLAVDIGGTFTDVVLLDDESGCVVTKKVLTTPRNPLDAVRIGIRAALDDAGLRPDALESPIVHATTLVTNALIEGTGARTALVTTAGFGDVLNMRDERRFEMFDFQLDMPDPPVPSSLIFELGERTAADGTVLQAPAGDETDALGERITSEGVAAVCVGFINSYANEANERQVAGRLRELLDIPVIASIEVAPVIREYPRFVTGVLNAKTVPVLAPYLADLEQWLREERFRHSVLIMTSNGGTVSADVAAQFPIRAVESGPAAGALAGSWFSRSHAIPELLCFDMGGTTAKACILQGGAPELTGTFEIARRYRHLAGSGWPAAVTSVDLVEIGAGGGSIAAVDALGRVTIGPESAGADPGPACYGRGGTAPTVTDADLLLGFQDPASFAGGRISLDRGAAEVTVNALATRAGMPLESMAAGIHQLVNQTMADAASAHATERGIELRGMPMLAFGGAGPVHACGVAELLECSTVLFPPNASVLSAFGTLVTPIRVDLATTQIRSLAELSVEDIDLICEPVRAEARELLAASGAAPADVGFAYAIDAQYEGQAAQLNVKIGTGRRWPASIEEVVSRFEERYRAVFGLVIPNVDIEVVTWRVTASAGAGASRLRPSRPSKAAEPSSRPARFGVDQEPVEVAVLERGSLEVGATIEGPAVVQEPDTTIVLAPGWEATVGADGTVVARHGTGSANGTVR